VKRRWSTSPAPKRKRSSTSPDGRTSRMNRSAPLALMIAAGCADGLTEPDLLLPTELSVEWDAAWNGSDDGLGALVPVDVMVYDGATGESIEGVEVLISTGDPGVIPVPVEGVLVIDDETDPLALWDASRDQYVAFDTELVPLAADDELGDAFADELLLETDEGGIARLYLYVDAFPSDFFSDDGFADLPILVEMIAPAGAERSFRLIPR
jgi:hypothetical protein